VGAPHRRARAGARGGSRRVRERRSVAGARRSVRAARAGERRGMQRQRP
jgi:hypothetical protein